MSFTAEQAYEVKVPMQIYWDSGEAIAQNDTHGGHMLEPGTVYISIEYSESLLPAIPIRNEPYPNGHVIGWLNVNENALPVWVGTATGNRQVLSMTIGTATGNRQVKAVWVGTATGNKKVF